MTTRMLETDWENRYDQGEVPESEEVEGEEVEVEEKFDEHFELDFTDDPETQLALGGARRLLDHRRETDEQGPAIPSQRFPQVETGADLLG